MAKHKWSLWDGMRCLEVGTVEGADEKAALKAVAPTAVLRPEKSYRVRIGASTVASFYPDEFARVQADQSAHEKDPAARAGGKPYLFSDMVKKLDQKKVADLLDAKTVKSLDALEAALERMKLSTGPVGEAIKNLASDAAKAMGIPKDILNGPQVPFPTITPRHSAADIAVHLARLMSRTIPDGTAWGIWEILLNYYGGGLRAICQVVTCDVVRGGYRLSVADAPHVGNLTGITISMEEIQEVLYGPSRAAPRPVRKHRISPLELASKPRCTVHEAQRMVEVLESSAPDLPLVGIMRAMGMTRFSFRSPNGSTRDYVVKDGVTV